MVALKRAVFCFFFFYGSRVFKISSRSSRVEVCVRFFGRRLDRGLGNFGGIGLGVCQKSGRLDGWCCGLSLVGFFMLLLLLLLLFEFQNYIWIIFLRICKNVLIFRIFPFLFCDMLWIARPTLFFVQLPWRDTKALINIAFYAYIPVKFRAVCLLFSACCSRCTSHAMFTWHSNKHVF